jgi:hypothetical protein
VVIEAEKLPCVVTVKLPDDVPVPVGVVTEIAPEVAPDGTVADNWVELATENTVAEVPLNFTEVAPVKFDPLTVTCVPTGPEDGLKPVTVGAEGGAVTVTVVLADVLPPLPVAVAV